MASGDPCAGDGTGWQMALTIAWRILQWLPWIRRQMHRIKGALLYKWLSVTKCNVAHLVLVLQT